MLGWLFGKATAGVIESTGEAVAKVARVVKGDKAAVEAAVHDEQMAVLAEHAAEMAVRPNRTKLDSFIDFLNRLPRVIITFWIFAILTWPAIDAKSFTEYITSMGLIPDELWQIAMVVLSLYFGGRIISSDIRKPKLSIEQKKQAIEIIERQQEKVIEANRPIIVTTPPTRKPAAPDWTKIPPLAKPQPSRPSQPTNPTPPLVKGRPVDIDKMIADLIEREGGWSNHRADSGKATMYGVTKATLKAWRGHAVTDDDVRALTKEEAAEIYRTFYYFQPSIDSLPVGLQVHVFDIAVNSGGQQAIKMLQQALNVLGCEVRVDGVCGPMTREACGQCEVGKIHNALVKIRRQFYINLADSRPKDKVFLAGWLNRADLFAA